MSFIKIKSPSNAIENPVMPHITKGMPVMKSAGKNYKVDVGKLLISETENIGYETGAILPLRRDYAEMAYGKDSYKEIVNDMVRLPYIRPYEDTMPLNRLPATTRSIPVRVNPGTASDNQGFTAPVGIGNEVKMNHRIKETYTLPTYGGDFTYLPEMVIPDLELKLPQSSVASGYDGQYKSIVTINEDFELLDRNNNHTVSSGFQTVYKPNIETTAGDVDLFSKVPETSVASGFTTEYLTQIETSLDGLELSFNKPETSIASGFATEYTTRINTPQVQGVDKISYSAMSGYEGQYKPEIQGDKPFFRTKIQPLKQDNDRITYASAIPRYNEPENLNLHRTKVSKKNPSQTKKYKF